MIKTKFRIVVEIERERYREGTQRVVQQLWQRFIF